ncbi:uncharacterized protein Dana_GF27452 [Drosophila ananassae]|uniref:Uncharacterized protein n=1 Tax=Drosophila ananassae TaxID=7217 RepID=A0A0P8YGD2_DROAN|nr:uncharacterized protein Dana_GF27452 [Drosophila ananassae]
MAIKITVRSYCLRFFLVLAFNSKVIYARTFFFCLIDCVFQSCINSRKKKNNIKK